MFAYLFLGKLPGCIKDTSRRCVRGYCGVIDMLLSWQWVRTDWLLCKQRIYWSWIEWKSTSTTCISEGNRTTLFSISETFYIMYTMPSECFKMLRMNLGMVYSLQNSIPYGTKLWQGKIVGKIVLLWILKGKLWQIPLMILEMWKFLGNANNFPYHNFVLYTYLVVCVL